MWKKIRRFLILALLALIVIQFVSIDKTNPPVVNAEDFITIHQPPAGVRAVLSNACYDCHSHETKYPWYTNVQPVAWWVKGHVKEGRKKLNFSRWSSYDAERAAHKLEEVVEEIEERHMPLKSYTWMHQEAKLSREQINMTIDWFQGLE